MHLSIILLCLLQNQYAAMQTNCMENIGSNKYLDCSSQNLHNIPSFSSRMHFNLVGANFRNNTIKEIVARSFENISKHLEHLDLSYNQISALNFHSFSGLVQLKSLRLGHNKLCLHSAYPEGIFNDLKELELLYSLGNICNNGHQSYPDQSLKDLMSLRKLSLDVALNFTFGAGFQHLLNLSSIEATGYDTRSVPIKINNNSFLNLRHSPISELIIRGSAYGTIESGALNHFNVLRTLNVACAEHLSSSIMKAIYEMPSASLETLIFDGVALNYNKGFCHPNIDNVQKLSIRQTGLTKDNMKQEFKKCLPNLQHLNIGLNGIYPIKFYPRNTIGSEIRLERGISEDKFWMNRALKTFDASYGKTASFFIKETYCKLTEQDLSEYFEKGSSAVSSTANLNGTKFIYHVPEEIRGSLKSTGATIFFCTVSPFIQALYMNDLSVGNLLSLTVALKCPWVIYPFDSLISFNMSGNEVGGLSCPILGMKRLKVFDCSRCKLTSLSSEYTKQAYLPNLEYLNLNDNSLGDGEGQDPDLLHQLTKLKEIHLSKNNFGFMPYNVFMNLKRLEIIDISKNVLTELDLNVTQLSNLKLLDISRNQFRYFNKRTSTNVENVHKISPNFVLNIHGNPFECSCDSMEFLTWIKSTKIKIMDKDTLLCDDKKTKLIEIDLELIEASCDVDNTRKLITIIIILAILSILLIVLGLVIYRYRWKLAWHVYIIRRRLNLCDKPPTNDPEFQLQQKQYDAFVAYATDDDIGRQWMKNILLPHVEEILGKRLHIFDRDSVVGNSRISELIYGMKHSTCTIFILTDDFLSLYEWEMVLYWAVRRGLNSIILCCIGGFVMDKMPPALGKVALEIQERFPTHYLEFPADQRIADDNLSFANIL